MRVAVLADSHLQRHVLRELLTELGHEVVFNHDPERLSSDELPDCLADVWLVSLQRLDEHQQSLLELLYGQDVPVLVGEAEAPPAGSEDFPRWQRSLAGKLDTLVAKTVAEVPAVLALENCPPVVDSEPASEVWLLAASLGGPAAVKEFLDVLPGDLPLGFLYAQHIDQGFEQALPRAVGRHSQWRVRLARNNDFVRVGEVVVVPVQHELAFCSERRMRFRERPWSGSYSPSVEQMMLNLAASFGHSCGTIVFSGMGEDGSRACMETSGMGMQIWAQDSQSSTCPSMPDSIRQTGYSSYSGTPRELARAIAGQAGQ